MDFEIDNVSVYNLSALRKKVVEYDISTDIIDDDLKRRIIYAIEHKYEQCFARMKEFWDVQLVLNGVQSIPTDPDAYATLVFAQPNYKDKKQREEGN